MGLEPFCEKPEDRLVTVNTIKVPLVPHYTPLLKPTFRTNSLFGLLYCITNLTDLLGHFTWPIVHDAPIVLANIAALPIKACRAIWGGIMPEESQTPISSPWPFSTPFRLRQSWSSWQPWRHQARPSCTLCCLCFKAVMWKHKPEIAALSAGA